VAYGLFNLENLLRVLQPWALGRSIDGLLLGSYGGLSLYVVIHLGQMAVGSIGQMFDARTYERIYAELAARLVLRQRSGGVDVSRVAARSALSRELVDFFERYVPIVVRSLYSVVGALLLLWQYDVLFVWLCLTLALPVSVMTFIDRRKTRRLNSGLNDELEREVDVIQKREAEDVTSHYHGIARWRIRLADWEALHFTCMELFVLAVLAAALLRSSLQLADAGAIVAVFRYIQMFVTGLDPVPMLVQQNSRLGDILTRLERAEV
jgi:ABC-type multidrug transport system fused ATPase/permease subunit